MLHDDLLEEAARRLDLLRKKLATLAPSDCESELESKFTRDNTIYCQDENITYPIVTGVDGGSYTCSTLAFDLYFIKVYGVTITSVEKEGRKQTLLANEKRIIDIDFMIPPHKLGDRVNLYRDIGELRVILESIDAGTRVLADGSIESLLTRPTHLKLDQLDRYSNLIDADVESLVEQRGINVSSVKPLVEQIAIEETDEKEAELKSSILELAEKAILTRKVFEKLLDKEEILMFVTKTGRSTSLFKRQLPDQYIISMYTREPGYAVEDETPIRLSSVVRLPKYGGLRDVGSEIGLVRGYVRLCHGCPVLRIEVVAPLRVLGENGRKVFIEEIRRLYSTCVNGYPYPLLLAHQKAHIEKKSAEIVIEALGFKGEMTGRESIELI